jgi:hypothetical protein
MYSDPVSWWSGVAPNWIGVTSDPCQAHVTQVLEDVRWELCYVDPSELRLAVRASLQPRFAIPVGIGTGKAKVPHKPVCVPA